MAENKMKKCSACGTDISKNAASCPHCGQKNKKPLYKRPWFIIVVVILLIAIISSTGEDTDNKETTAEPKIEAQVEYVKVDVSTLMEELEANAMKAEKNYDKKHLEITGRLGVIDSDGDYISLYPQNNKYAISGVQCYIKNDEQTEKVMNMSIDDIVTVKGKIKSVGEVLGYTLDIDIIE